MSRLSRIALVLLLAAILANTAVLANPLGGAQPRRNMTVAFAPMDLAARFWNLLTRMWNKNGSEMDPDGLQTKNGSEMDPSGAKLQTSVPVTPDNGSEMDPNE